MPELVAIGETMAALSCSRIGPLRHAGTLEVSIAGAESTVAIGVGRLGHSAAWVGRLGDDELGERVRMTLRAEGVQVYAVADATAPTGLLIKERRTADQRRVHYYRAASAGAHLCIGDIPPFVVEEATVLHTSAITLALSSTAAAAVHEAVDRARSAGVTVSLDANYRRKLWPLDVFRRTVTSLLPSVDLLFASLDEAQSLLRTDATDPAELALALREYGPGTVVITMGADGALSASSSGIVPTSAVRVTEIDPVGAGDSFVAGYLSAVLSGKDDRDRLAAATRVAAFSVAAQGDWEGLPTAAELLPAAESAGEISR
ncbi:sugar kinase [Streptomyces sp. NPDC002262]|uniref:sugar kinase n=1 Tax=Streptomyces sp. NPDC002262 TaxID=3154414 RepID=UPI00331997B0